MGLLFEMENDVVEIKDKFKTKRGKNPLDFKVFMVKRDEPHIPTEDINGFNPRNVGFALGTWELFALYYDVVLKIGEVTMRLSFQEFINLTDTLRKKSDSLIREISKNRNDGDMQVIINHMTASGSR